MFASKFVLGAGLALSLAGVATAATVKQEQIRQQAQQVCMEDAMKLCSEVIADDAKTTACVRSHKAQLSPPCLKVYNQAFGK